MMTRSKFLRYKILSCFLLLGLFMGVIVNEGFSEGRASSNDPELKLLFDKLSQSKTASAADKITNKIWEIWTNDASSEPSRSVMDRGIKLMSQSRLDEAEKLFSGLIKKEPDYIEAWNKRATVRFMMGKTNASLNDVFVVLEKEPNHFGAVSGLGLILMQEDDFEGAFKAYKRLLQINPFSRDALHLIPILEQTLLGESI